MIICKVICSNFKSDLFDLLKHAKVRHVRMFLGEGTCITAGGYLFIAETGPIIIPLNTPRRYDTGVMSCHRFDYDCLFTRLCWPSYCAKIEITLNATYFNFTL